MALNEINPGLRQVYNGSKFVAKVSLVVPPGDELTVSDDVAAQLLDGRSGFKERKAADLQGLPTDEAPEAPAEPVEDAPKKSRKG